MKYEDLSGKTFNRLTVLKLHHKKQLFNKNGKPNGHLYYYECLCSCGKISIVASTLLKNNSVKSCGCLREDEIKKSENKHRIHGMKNTRIYKIWSSMRGRCHYKYIHGYERYGGRGIKVCQEWEENFMNFYNWSINNGYRDDLTIDRINFNGNYEPSNCRWVTKKEQARNTKSNHNITYKGETHCLKEWSEILGINYGTLKGRIQKRKWNIEKAFTEPIHEEKRRY